MSERVPEPSGRPRRARRRGRTRGEPAVPVEVVVPGRPVGPGEVAVPGEVVEHRAFIDVPRGVEEDVVERPRRRPFNLGPLAVFAIAFVFLLAAAASVAAVACTLTALLMTP